MKKKFILLSILILAVILSGCYSSDNNDKKQVIFLNNFMTMSDKLFEYEKNFEKLHPDIDVKIESIGDKYEDISIVRLNSNKAGDVMVIPSYMSQEYYKDYYEPLYSTSAALKKYRFSNIKSIDGKVYSIPLSMNISGGILYDMKVLNDAGIENTPESLEELKEALKAVKSKGDAIPLYSNARGESQLTFWNSLIYSLEGDANYNNTLLNKNNLFSPESEYYNVYKFLYECVSENLIEEPFVSSKWEDGINLIEEGKLGAAVVSLDMYNQAKKVALNSNSIVYEPLKNSDGEYYLYGEPSYGIGINKESNNKEEAKMWLEYLLDDTDFLEFAGDTSMLEKNPESNYEEYINKDNVRIIYPSETSEENIGKFEKIDNEACLGIYGGSFTFNLINEAASGKKSYEELCDEWNSKWNSALIQINNN